MYSLFFKEYYICALKSKIGMLNAITTSNKKWINFYWNLLIFVFLFFKIFFLENLQLTNNLIWSRDSWSLTAFGYMSSLSDQNKFSSSVDPCKRYACQLQDCLSKHNYNEEMCSLIIERLRKCCHEEGGRSKQLAPTPTCSGFVFK